MSVVADYGLDSPTRKLPILLLNLDDTEGNKKMDTIHIQKIIRYFQYLSQEDLIEYSNYNLGGVSYELQENIESLEEFGLIEQVNSDGFHLSQLGVEASKELAETISKADLDKLSFAKRQLNDLSSDELMFFMYNLLPQTRANSTVWERLEKKKDLITRQLFKKGKINSITAAKWLGLSETRFLTTMS
jgi:hypothetical protein